MPLEVFSSLAVLFRLKGEYGNIYNVFSDGREILFSNVFDVEKHINNKEA